MYYRNDLPPIPILPDLAVASNCPLFFRRDIRMQRFFISIVSLVFLISCAENSEDISSEQKVVSQAITPISAPSPEPSSTSNPSPTAELPEPESEENISESSVSLETVGCASSGHSEPRREEMLEGHELWLGRLTGSLLEEGYKLLEGGSVPDGLIIDGKVHLWWVSAADHTIHHGVVDDDQLEDLGPVSIDGEIFSGMVDPDIVQFDDGSIGLTVLDGFDRSGPPGPICHLRSTDGQNFVTYGSILEKEDRFDPSLVVFEDQWWLAVGIPSEEDSVTEIYSGIDGKNFTYQSQVEGAVPDLSHFDGKFQLLTCSKSGMRSYSSSNGRDWNLDQVIPFRGCDPARITGSDFFAYKIEHGGGNEMPPPIPDGDRSE